MRGGGQNLRFLANNSLYLSNGKRGPRLLLITIRKSYTGSRLVPTSMTLNAKIEGFMDFFGDSRLRHKSISFIKSRHATIVMRSR